MKSDKRICGYLIGLMVLFCFAMPAVGSADDIYLRPEKFKEFNPDGDKYQFVKRYIQALEHLKVNALRSDKEYQFAQTQAPDVQIIKSLILNNKKDTLNLRVAQKFLTPLRTSENKLILKAISLFEQYTNEQIEMNKQEVNFLTDYSKREEGQNFSQDEKSALLDKQLSISSQRKQSSKKLLEASMLVNKILVSNKGDHFGELVNLGITQRQRKDLLLRLHRLMEDKESDDIQEGQSFFQASLITLNDRLSDYSWGTID